MGSSPAPEEKFTFTIEDLLREASLAAVSRRELFIQGIKAEFGLNLPAPAVYPQELRSDLEQSLPPFLAEAISEFTPIGGDSTGRYAVDIIFRQAGLVLVPKPELLRKHQELSGGDFQAPRGERPIRVATALSYEGEQVKSLVDASDAVVHVVLVHDPISSSPLSVHYRIESEFVPPDLRGSFADSVAAGLGADWTRPAATNFSLIRFELERFLANQIRAWGVEINSDYGDRPDILDLKNHSSGVIDLEFVLPASTKSGGRDHSQRMELDPIIREGRLEFRIISESEPKLVEI